MMPGYTLDAAPNDHLLLPSALVWHGDRPLITFAHVAIVALETPFVDIALDRSRTIGFVPLDAFDRNTADLRIAGAIHHMTRCGSTLLRRQFDAMAGIVAISEPFMFLQLLEGPAAPPATTRRRLRQLAAAWRDGIAPLADHMVIKWPSLLAQHARTLADAFPEVPMIFLHRDAVEVLASIEAAPLGGLTALRPRHVGRSAPSLPIDEMETWAMVLAHSCRRAAGTAGMATLDYDCLPAAGWEEVATHFGLDPSPADRRAMQVASGFHAKYRTAGQQRIFLPDGPARRRSCSDHVRDLAEAILAPAVAALRAATPPTSLRPPGGARSDDHARGAR